MKMTKYESLRKATKDYGSLQKAFNAPRSNIGGSKTQNAPVQKRKTEPRLLVRTNVSVKNMESNVAYLAN